MTARAKFEIVGWVLFILSALFFTVASLRSGDLTSLAGSLFFLIACFFFLRPLLARPADPAKSPPA